MKIVLPHLQIYFKISFSLACRLIMKLCVHAMCPINIYFYIFYLTCFFQISLFTFLLQTFNLDKALSLCIVTIYLYFRELDIPYMTMICESFYPELWYYSANLQMIQ